MITIGRFVELDKTIHDRNRFDCGNQSLNDFLKTKLDNFLHKNSDIAEKIQCKILQAERERKELSGIRKLAKDRAKKANLHNKKLP